VVEPGTVRPEDFVEYRLVRLAAHLERRFAGALAPSALSPRQFSALAVLAARPGITSAELARAVLTTPQGMHALLEQLQNRGLVERRSDRGRGRAAPLRPTAGGRDLLAAAGAQVGALDAETRDRLGDADHRELVRLLGRLEEVVGLTAASGPPAPRPTPPAARSPG
jgi:DNA-binding MarR family transcriptional regulator